MPEPSPGGASAGDGDPAVQRPWVAVIIPHYNDVARLGRCLGALTEAGTAGAEIVVVDNGSRDPLDGLQARHSRIRFVTEPQQGAAAARNRGVRETTAPQILFLDADCVPAADWLAVARRIRGPDLSGGADLVGGRVDVFDETPPPRSGAQAFETVFSFDCRAYVEKMGFSVTANLLTRRAVFEATGDFVVGLSEDKDWCLRATARGYSLAYADDLRVSHPTRGDWPALVRKWRRLTAESFALNGSGTPARLRWFVRAMAMPVSAVAHLPRVLSSDRLHGPRDRLRAAATLARLRLLRAGWMLRQAAGRQI